MNSAEVLIKFKGDSSDVDKTTKKVTSGFGSLTKSIALGNLAAKGITKAFQVLSSNMDSAIRRFDVLNNFPKVMSNLGISTQEADEVIKDLSEQLKGLPTALDSAAMAVQRLTSKNGNVKQSEKIFLALNNAILAGGASADIQANALEQMSQAYAKGKPDMMEWRSMMTAMPAQLKQVATAMGYTDAALLGEAIRAKDGEKEFARMIDTMQRMNTEGVAGFKSFEEQARNATGGVSTSITNMKTAFARGIAEMIKNVDKALKPFGGLSGTISSIGKVGEEAFKKIGNILGKIIPKLISFGKWIVKNKDWIIAIVAALGTMYAAIKLLMFINIVKNAIIGFKTALIMLKTTALLCGTQISTLKGTLMLLNATFLMSPIFWLIAAIGLLVGAFVLLWNKCEAFRNFWIGLWEKIKNVFGNVIDSIKLKIENIRMKFTTLKNHIKKITDGIKNAFISLKTKVGNAINGIANFIKSIPEKVTSIPGKIFNIFKELPGKMLKIGKDMIKGLWKGIKDKWNKLKKGVKDFCKGIKDKFKEAFHIGSPSKLMADEVGQWIPKGIAVGINANTDSVYDSIKNISKNINSNFDLSPQMTGSMNNSYSPNVNVYNDINIKQDSLGQMVKQIKTYSGGSPNDYNYGAGW